MKGSRMRRSLVLATALAVSLLLPGSTVLGTAATLESYTLANLCRDNLGYPGGVWIFSNDSYGGDHRIVCLEAGPSNTLADGNMETYTGGVHNFTEFGNSNDLMESFKTYVDEGCELAVIFYANNGYSNEIIAKEHVESVDGNFKSFNPSEANDEDAQSVAVSVEC